MDGYKDTRVSRHARFARKNLVGGGAYAGRSWLLGEAAGWGTRRRMLYQNYTPNQEFAKWPGIALDVQTSAPYCCCMTFAPGQVRDRSEEHTSELQSLR